MPRLKPRPFTRRAASLCTCAVVALSLLGATAPVALSASLGGGAFNELVEASREEATQTSPTVSTPATSSGSSSNSTTIIVLGMAAAIALLIAIAFVIVRDARRVAPATDGRSASMGDPAARTRKRRAKARAARQQRKRNR